MYKHILIGALFLGVVPACSSEGTTGSDVTRTGSVRMALEARGTSGTLYRLETAEFQISGPTTVTVTSAPDEEFIKVDLQAGDYTTTIQPGWQLVVVAADSTATPIEATLVSASQVTTPIVTGEQTEVRFDFDISGEVIPFGFGRANIGIGVIEGAPPEPVCGNGVEETGEACDDGNTTTETTCPGGQTSCTVCNADCSAEVTVSTFVCGNGVREPGEVCDDGDGGTNDGCNQSCQATLFVVNTPTPTPETYAEVAKAPDGRFVAVWSTASAVFLRRFDRLGNPLGADVQVTGQGVSTGFAPQVAVAQDLSAAVSFSSTANGGSVWVARFTASGAPSGPTRMVASNLGTVVESSVALSPNNQAVVAAGTPNGITLYQFDTANNLMASAPVAQGFAPDQRRPVIASDPTGRSVVVFDIPGGAGRTLVMRRYTPNLGPLGSVTQVVTSPTANRLNGDVAARADGSFFVSWQSPEAAGHRTYAAGFAADGSMLFTTNPLSPLDGRDHVETSITASENGRVTVAWATINGQGTPTVDAAVLDASTGLPLGTLSLPGASSSYPAISADQLGEFVVVFPGTDVLGQLFDASGTARGVSTSVAP